MLKEAGTGPPFFFCDRSVLKDSDDADRGDLMGEGGSRSLPYRPTGCAVVGRKGERRSVQGELSTMRGFGYDLSNDRAPFDEDIPVYDGPSPFVVLLAHRCPRVLSVPRVQVAL